VRNTDLKLKTIGGSAERHNNNARPSQDRRFHSERSWIFEKGHDALKKYDKPDDAGPSRTRRWSLWVLLAVSGMMASTVQATTYQFTMYWTNTDSAVTADLIDRSFDGVNYSPLATVPPAPASYTDTGLEEGTAYYYRMSSQSPAGVSDYSNVAVANTPPLLLVTSPVNDQTVDNGLVAGTARGANGLLSVRVNDQAATIDGTGTNWLAAVAMTVGTNVLTVVATDNSVNHNVMADTISAILTAGSGRTSSTAITQLQNTTNGWLIGFQSVSGMVYQVQYAATLAKTNTWQTLLDNIAGDGTLIQILDPTAALVPQRFYRIGSEQL
jgi:hypothetical protein